jgi:alcohol dehydrogenase (NADP+)
VRKTEPTPSLITSYDFRRPKISGRSGQETQEMLEFCGKHNITADVEVIAIQQVNEAYERLLKSDVKYRFSMDMASLKA